MKNKKTACHKRSQKITGISKDPVKNRATITTTDNSKTIGKVGIWGFGIVGKSAAQFFKDNNQIQVFDNRELSTQEQEFLKTHDISITTDLEQFLEHNDIIIPSPSVRLENYYKKYEQKWWPEFDIFAHYFKKPIIAITGSVGKTSVTKLLSDLLCKSGKNYLMGGNIGIACLDLVREENIASGIVLEASSFQLTHTRSFAPDLAILTNIYPNHLDWHGTEQAYFEAKARIFMYQTPEQKALVPLNLKERLETYQNSAGKIKSQLNYFHDTNPTEQELASIGEHQALFYIASTPDSKIIKKYSQETHHNLIDISQLPPLTFDQNWLVICSALDILEQMDNLMGHKIGRGLSIPLEQVALYANQLSIPQHRLEKCATINNIEIYNDSKATTTASTLAAVNQLKQKPILLILGGLSKGVDRAPFIEALKNKVKKIYCFGAEAEKLSAYCEQYAIPAEKLDSLDSVLHATLSQANPGDQILFSPSGSSFDLFKDYEHRGTVFKELVKKYTQNL